MKSRLVRESDSQCRSSNCPGFDPSILRHSGIWRAADEALLNIVHKKKKIQKNPPFKKIKYYVLYPLENCQLRIMWPKPWLWKNCQLRIESHILWKMSPKKDVPNPVEECQLSKMSLILWKNCQLRIMSRILWKNVSWVKCPISCGRMSAE
jgi:hypothetical protein